MSSTVIAKDTLGDIWSWGLGTNGQNGDGDTSHNYSPEKISQFSSTNTIEEAWTMNDTIIVKDTNDDIWSWGAGIAGQNGDGDLSRNDSPEKISQFSSTNTIEEAWTMNDTIIAKDTNDDIWSWGFGENGQNGDGDPSHNSSPEKISQFSSTNTVEEAWTMNDTIIVKDINDDIWSWGRGNYGQTGDGVQSDNVSPTQIIQFNNANTIEEAWTMNNTIVVKDTAGEIWSWGKGDDGQTGDGDPSHNNSPEKISQFSSTNTIEEAWTMLDTIVVKDTAGEVWSWGDGVVGQNGDGEETINTSPEKIPHFISNPTIEEAWPTLGNIIVKDTAGDIWAWGFGQFGQNGNSETTNKSSPVKIHDVDGTTNVFGQGVTIEVAWTMNNTIVAKDSIGDIWSWGQGDYGQNGDGDISHNHSPEKIFSALNSGTIKIENITSTSATVSVEDFTNGTGNHEATKATLTYGVSGGTSQTMDDTNLDDGISFELTGLTEGQNYDLSIAYFNASDTQIGSPVTSESPLVTPRPPSSGGGGLSTGAIIGIATGAGGAVLIGGGVGGFFLYKKKRGF